MATETPSQAAARSMRGVASVLRDQIVAHVSAEGPRTCDEIEVELELRHQTASARISELKADGVLVDTGERRETRSGRNAAVYRVSL